MGLTISRKAGQSIKIGDDVTVTIQKIRATGSQVKVTVDAPENVRILRGEIKPMNDEEIEIRDLDAEQDRLERRLKIQEHPFQASS